MPLGNAKGATIRRRVHDELMMVLCLSTLPKLKTSIFYARDYRFRLPARKVYNH